MGAKYTEALMRALPMKFTFVDFILLAILSKINLVTCIHPLDQAIVLPMF